MSGSEVEFLLFRFPDPASRLLKLPDAEQVEIEWGYERDWCGDWAFEAQIEEIHADPVGTRVVASEQ